MKFEDALRQNLEAEPNLKRRGKKILEVLDAKPSRARTRRINRMERHALASLDPKQLAKLNVPATALVSSEDGLGIDWSTIDWGKAIEKLLNVLLKLLPFLLL